MTTTPTLLICHWKAIQRDFLNFCFARFSDHVVVVGECESAQECRDWLQSNHADFVIIAVPSEANTDTTAAELKCQFPNTEFVIVSPFGDNQLPSFYRRVAAMAVTEPEFSQ